MTTKRKPSRKPPLREGDDLDAEFSRIAETAAREAAAIRCSKEDYLAGLKQIIEELEVSVDAAEEDIKREEHLDHDEDES